MSIGKLSFRNMRRRLFRLLLPPAILGALALSYAALVERTWIERTELECPCDGMQGTVKFVILSDIHANIWDGAYLDEIVERTLAEKPDAVLLLGDYFRGHEPDSGMDPQEFIRHMKPLSSVPLFAVLGNHDMCRGEEATRAVLEELGACIVQDRADGQPVRLQGQGGAMVDIGGIRCLYYFKKPGTVPQPRDGVPLILLSHTPVGAEYAADGTALVLSGHTHGGQVCWPWGGPVYMADGRTPRAYVHGKLDIAGHRTYVTRGLGTSVLPIRFFCRPEFTVLTLRGTASKP